MTPVPETSSPTAPSPDRVQKAIRLTYAQMMLGSIFGASTGGMFLIGFILTLGADDIRLGLFTTLPMAAVVLQLVSAYLIEAGMSCKKLTVIAGFVSPLCWLLIAAIPLGAHFFTSSQQLLVLLGVIILAAMAGNINANARATWIGELIPADRRARFFGSCALFAGIIGATFAVGEGRFLDFIKSRGALAFTCLFFFGTLFGLAAASLNVPQPDCPVTRSDTTFREALRDAWNNRPLRRLLAAHLVLALGSISAPFATAYCLRDVGMSYFGLGCVNSITTVSILAASPFFGKLIDRLGGRPVLIASLALMAPCGLTWFFICPGRPDIAYRILPWASVWAGVTSAATNVAISTMIYKMTTARGRPVQLALYSICVVLASAPMPLLGGWLVTTLKARGWIADVRLTFYLWMVFVAAAAGLACRIQEPGSASTRTLVFVYFPRWLAALPDMVMSLPEQIFIRLKKNDE